MEEKEVEICFRDNRFKLKQQRLDRIISMVSKRLRSDTFTWFNELEDVKVYVDGELSEFYFQLIEPIAKAIDLGYFDEFKHTEPKTIVLIPEQKEVMTLIDQLFIDEQIHISLFNLDRKFINVPVLNFI